MNKPKLTYLNNLRWVTVLEALVLEGLRAKPRSLLHCRIQRHLFPDEAQAPFIHKFPRLEKTKQHLLGNPRWVIMKLIGHVVDTLN